MTPDDVARASLLGLCVLLVLLDIWTWNTLPMDPTRRLNLAGFGLLMVGTAARNAIALQLLSGWLTFLTICLQIGGGVAIASGWTVANVRTIRARKAAR